MRKKNLTHSAWVLFKKDNFLSAVLDLHLKDERERKKKKKEKKKQRTSNLYINIQHLISIQGKMLNSSSFSSYLKPDE